LVLGFWRCGREIEIGKEVGGRVKLGKRESEIEKRWEGE